MNRSMMTEEPRDMTPAEVDALCPPELPEFLKPTQEELDAEAREAASTADWDAEDFDAAHLAAALPSWDAVLSAELDRDASPAPRRAPAPVEDYDDAEDEGENTLLFARTNVDEIGELDDADREVIAQLSAKYPARSEDDETASAAVAVRPPMAPVDGVAKLASTALAKPSGKALEVDPGWGMQAPFLIDDEKLAVLVTLGDTHAAALERVQLLLEDRVAFRDSGEAMIWTGGRVWLDNPRFEAELHRLLIRVIRAIKMVEMPARMEAVKSSGDYKLAEKDLERAKLSGTTKDIRAAEKDLKDIERAAVGGVEKMWRRLEDLSPTTVVRDAITHLRAECHVPDSEWLSGGRLLNYRDWTVDVYTGEKWKHRREDRLTHMVDLDYDVVVGAQNDDVDSIFDRLPEEGQEGVKDLLRRYFGSMLTWSVNHKSFLYLWGENNSGKSTIVKAAEAAVSTDPKYGRGANLIHSAGPEAFQRMSGDASKSFPRHQLRGRRGVWVDEAQDVNYDASFLNRMTNPAGDIESQPLFAKKGERVLWKPEASIVLVGNRAGGIPMQEGVQRRMLVVKAGARLADGENDVTTGEGAEQADVGIVERLQTEEARAAMLWQMILGARDLGEVGDRGAMEGTCAGWLNDGREANAADVVDAREIWLRDFVDVVDADGDDEGLDPWFYSLREAFVEVQRINAGFLLSNNAFDRVTDRSLSEFLATKGFQKKQDRRCDGTRQNGFKRLRRRPIDRIPTELQEFSKYAAGCEGRLLGRSRSGGIISVPTDSQLSSMPREELEAMVAAMYDGGAK